MNNILTKPFSNTEYADFAVYANDTQRRIEDFNGDKYALLASEVLVNGTIQDISQTPEYIAEQKAIAKQSLVKEYADTFKEFDRICGAKFSRGLCTTSQITAQRTTLQNELTQKIQEINNG